MTRRQDVEGCPLCGSAQAVLLCADRLRSYLRCRTCALIFVPSESHLDTAEEKARYDLHRNDPADPGYRAFLMKLVDGMLPYLPPGSDGLDFGSGPGPALSVIFASLGYRVTDYDPYYAPDARAIGRSYDFVACTETVEHFCRPAESWSQLAGLVKKGGVLGVMTGIYGDIEDFPSWRYKDDPTHVAFYSAETMEWIARRYSLDLLWTGGTVVVFRRR